MEGSILAVDPGNGGALAFVNMAGALIVHDMPLIKPGKRSVIDRVEVARIIDAAGPIVAAYVEYSATRPGEGSVQSFTFGHGRGIIMGIITAHFIPIHEPHPVTWKRALGIRPGSGKDVSRALAKNWWPKQAEEFCRIKDEGRAEAALIGFYGWKHFHGKLAA